MLTRLYIDNFQCFEKFEYRPARKQLILGGNGSGKSTLMEALYLIRQFATQRNEYRDLFPASQRTRGLNLTEQTFETGASLSGGKYTYRLVVEPGPDAQSETLHLDGQLLLESVDGRLVFVDGRPSRDLLEGHSAFMWGRSDRIAQFREWLAALSCLRINPFVLKPTLATMDPVLKPDLSNFAAWYSHLAQVGMNPGNAAFLGDLRDVLDGFRRLRFECLGENLQELVVEFQRDDMTVELGWDELSEGQRCLICLYAILHFVVAKGGTVIIDEPENFISLREIQPWLMAADDMADDHKGQVLLISHHPGLIDQWAPSHGVQFVRDGIGPVRVEPFRGQPESPLSASELVARGWERE
jgi:predicted ATPase